MVRKLIEWALSSPFIVVLLALALVAIGVVAFVNVNVEAYPDPAPAIIEVVAQFPGASAEEVERQVTIPLEVTLAGMPGLQYVRTKSLFGLSHLRIQFEYGTDYMAARQEVINRLQFTQPLPPGVQPQLSPESPTGEIYRYTLRSPKDDAGRDLYTLNDLKALEDWNLEREFRRIPRIADITSFGGTVKRYEVHPDPDRMQRYGVTLQQLQNALASSNANTGGDYLRQGQTVSNVRGVGLIGEGEDPVNRVLGMKDPREAARTLRALEAERLREIRQVVIASVNNVPVRVDDVVEGGPVPEGGALGVAGVVVGHQTRLGQVALAQPKTEHGRDVVDRSGQRVWLQEPEKVQGIILLRKGAESLTALRDVEARVKELNENEGRLLPGVKVETYYDRTDLINITTETVRENLFVGMVLVTMILLMFLSNVRSALIVAVNIPLALLFAFTVLWARGKSANLLSIGAVDFGIIVDSSVIMVENIYRHLAAGEYRDLPLKERILRASGEVEKALFFSTAIMVCAFIPLFTMSGPEGQIFAPMADTYAFALGGALLLALVLAPVLCLLLFRNLKPARDNFLVRWLKRGYLRNLEFFLNHRALTLGVFSVLILGTVAWLLGLPVLQKLDETDQPVAPWLRQVSETARKLPKLGREFMPELEEGNLWIRGTFPVNISLDAVSSSVTGAGSESQFGWDKEVFLRQAAKKRDTAVDILTKFPEVELVVSQLGRPDDGTDSTGFYNAEFFVPLKRQKDWPAVKEQKGWLGLMPTKRPRTKDELIAEMNGELNRVLVGVDWNFSQNIRDNVMEALSGVKGDNSVKIFGPDLARLEELADKVRDRLQTVKGIENVGVFRIMGQSNVDLRVDRRKCARWGVPVSDVNNVIDVIRGKPATQVIEGERFFDLTVRWPERLRDSESAMLNIPVDVSNNTVTQGGVASVPQTPQGGGAQGLAAYGTQNPGPVPTGNQNNATYNNLSATPRRPLEDLVRPLAESEGSGKSFLRPGASAIYREDGRRLIAVKFSVRDRDLGSAVAEAQQKTADLFQGAYHAEWSGEFQEMQAAEAKLMIIIPVSVGLVVVLLYLAFRSMLDVLVVLSNVVALSLGGVWALLLTNTNFSISAAVGFISIFGVAIMDGLLLVSYFNHLRAHGLPLREAILEGSEKRVRPVMMTALTAIFGLLPAALSTRIGAQTQRPLAIVVVGGMILTLAITRYLMPVLYSFYGHREPPAGAGGLAH
jgi:cobalt-zinc-cadmium resistance protein CzcA